MSDLISREATLAAISDDKGIQYPGWWYKDRIRTVPEVQGWILVSERLPDKPARYLVTNSRWGEFEVDWNIWTGSRWLYNGKPIAWMPMPEPYEEVDT